MTKENYYELCAILQSLVVGQLSSQDQYAQVIYEIFTAFEQSHLKLERKQ